MKRLTLLITAALLMATCARPEYVVLRNGQRLNVTGYQLSDGKYRLQLQGGFVEVPSEDVVAIEPEEVFSRIVPQAAESVKKPFTELIQGAAAKYSVDADLITSVIAAESTFDPRENIEAGTRYLRELLQLYKNDLALALAAYNAGPEQVERYGRVPPFAETVSYVRRVTRAYHKAKTTPVSAGQSPARKANAKGLPVHRMEQSFRSAWN